MWHKAVWMKDLMRRELIWEGLQILFATITQPEAPTNQRKFSTVPKATYLIKETKCVIGQDIQGG